MRENSEKFLCVASVSTISERTSSKLCGLPVWGHLPYILIGRKEVLLLQSTTPFLNLDSADMDGAGICSSFQRGTFGVLLPFLMWESIVASLDEGEPQRNWASCQQPC